MTREDTQRYLENLPDELHGMKDQITEIIEAIDKSLDDKIISPFLHTITQDFTVSIRLTQAFFLSRLSEELLLQQGTVASWPVQSNETSLDRDKVQKSLYLGYLVKVMSSALILLGSTDYIGSLILLRSVFELLVGIATEETGGMKKRIWSIDFLSESEKKKLYVTWNNLNPWAHPYQKWQKEICPVFYGWGQHFHPKLFKTCIEYTEDVLDFMLTITIDCFGVKPQEYLRSGNPLEVSDLDMLRKRLKETERDVVKTIK
jgi:hypothetical protein